MSMYILELSISAHTCLNYADSQLRFSHHHVDNFAYNLKLPDPRVYKREESV